LNIIYFSKALFDDYQRPLQLNITQILERTIPGGYKMGEFRFEVKSQKALEVSIAGDASIKPGSDGEIIALSVGSVTVDDKKKESILLICNNDCELRIPTGIKLAIQDVGGDAMLSGLNGGLTVNSVGGDLLLRDMAAAAIQRVGGDLEISHLKGELTIDRLDGDLFGSDLERMTHLGHIGGDVTLSNLQGMLDAEKISGDLLVNESQSIHANKVNGDVDLFHVRGDIAVKTSGDVSLQPADKSVERIDLEANGDVDLYWPSALGASFDLNSDGGEIEIALGDRDEDLETQHAEFVHADGKVKVGVHANGDISITSHLRKAPRVDVTGAAGRLDDSKSWEDEFTAGFHEKWGQFEKEFDRFPERFEKTFGEKMDHVGDRIEKAMHKIKHGVRMDINGKRAVVIATALAGKQAERSGEQPAPKSEPVTEDERKMILKMLQEKKISVEEAEKLFETLEGRSEEAS
jgi:hypothetical protein